MCPDAPSAYPSLAKVRKAAAMCPFAHSRSAYLSVNVGMWCMPVMALEFCKLVLLRFRAEESKVTVFVVVVEVDMISVGVGEKFFVF